MPQLPRSLATYAAPQLAAPSLALSPETDDYGDGYPFSVKPDKPLTARDLMRYQRDHYEGTPYDLTQGIAGEWSLRLGMRETTR